jgi:hypothetical protein
VSILGRIKASGLRGRAVPGALKSSGQASLVSERSFSLRPPQLVGVPVLRLVRASGGKQIEQLPVGLRCE